MFRASRLLRAAAASKNDAWTATLTLPSTKFPARTQPDRWDTLRSRITTELFDWQQTNRPKRLEDGTDNTFVLHDGPPYANGPVHVGHAVNKVLKDIILRTELARGKRVDYRPGWDCHGLPIELKAQEGKGQMTPPEIRAAARALAESTVDEQMAAFKSWGIMANWRKPYLTMDTEFEARQLRVWKSMVEKGLIYRQNRPVHWSPSSRTALAEAELEYEDSHKVTAAYIKFPITKLPPMLEQIPGVKRDQLSALIWTTTPWTLPANTAIGIRSDITYSLIELPAEGQMLVAQDRLQALEPYFDGVLPEIIIKDLPGAALVEGPTEYLNVLSGKTSRIVNVDFVTSTTGTGLVHLAAGHGMDDYLALRALGFNDVFAPVDEHGKFTAEALPSDPALLQGLHVESHGTRVVLEILRNRPDSLPVKSHDNLSLVLAAEDFVHKNPIDWRTKKPIIVRATEQWFVNVESIQDAAIQSLEAVTFAPETGKTRLQSFLRGRSQWCVSRQRAWGTPIPALYKKDTGEAVMTPESIDHIINEIETRKGSDTWWSDPPDDPAWISPHLPAVDYVRGTDTMDVWFDSGTSWTSMSRREGKPVSDVVVEGTDQHRGWFQSSVLTSIASQSKGSLPAAPFGKLITHGFTLDSKGHKMSKSLGNVVTPEEIKRGVLRKPGKDSRMTFPTQLKATLGPDVLRLWVASSDYTKDISISEPSIRAVHQALTKYRTTFKFLLGVTSDYPEQAADFRFLERLTFADQRVLLALSKTSATVHALQSNYDFSRAVMAINSFINQDLSAAYLETAKDRLYADLPMVRLHTQTILLLVLDELMMMLGPITPFLVHEVWENSPHTRKHLGTPPLHRLYDRPWCIVDPEDAQGLADLEASERAMQHVIDAVKAAQEIARKAGHLGSGLACNVEILVPREACDDFKALISEMDAHDELAPTLVVSGVEVLPLEPELRKMLQEENERTHDSPDAYNDLAEMAKMMREWREKVEWEVKREFDIELQGGAGSTKGEVRVFPAPGAKCERCWKYTVDVIQPSEDEPKEEIEPICDRCQRVLRMKKNPLQVTEDDFDPELRPTAYPPGE